MDAGACRAFQPDDARALAHVDPEQLRIWELHAELREGPVPIVVDTSGIRTGLHAQLANAQAPASLYLAQAGRARLFIELETLYEIYKKLPLFAEQLEVPQLQLTAMFNEHWLPWLRVVSVPPPIRDLDPRASAVRELDADDYPTAALAGLLSPCILLTHNYRHFRPLGVFMSRQSTKAIVAVADVRHGETRFQAVAMVPAVPVLAVGATAKWARQKIGRRMGHPRNARRQWRRLVLQVAGGAQSRDPDLRRGDGPVPA